MQAMAAYAKSSIRILSGRTFKSVRERCHGLPIKGFVGSRSTYAHCSTEHVLEAVVSFWLRGF